MNSPPTESPHDGDRMFQRLHDRATPELDSSRLWRRIETELAPRHSSLWSRAVALVGTAPAPLRLGYAFGALAIVGFVGWAALGVLSSDTDAPQFVLLTAPDELASEVGFAEVPSQEVELEVRLVRGFDGAVPDEVSAAQLLGVGGADPLSDVRERIRSLLPFAEYGIVGAWRGVVVGGDGLDVPLTDGYRLVAQSTDTEGPSALRLNGMQLAGAAGAATGNMSLEPGRLYILGVLPAGAGDPELVLLIRAVNSPPGRR